MPISLVIFFRSIWLRFRALKEAQPDPRLDELPRRLWGLFLYGILQARQPRYWVSGLIHMVIFWGFVVLGLRSLQLILFGLGIPALDPFEKGGFWGLYSVIKDLFEILVLLSCMVAVVRRVVFRPERYKGSHQFEAYLVLGLISFLMITDMLFEGSYGIITRKDGFSLVDHITAPMLNSLSQESLASLYKASFLFHLLAFFVFLNLLPASKHFHIITALPNVFFRRLKKGAIKPARYQDVELEELEYLGVKVLEDLTWKHILDLYTCTECGRCSDNCPAHLTGRHLSPKLFTMSLREHLYQRYPLFKAQPREEKVLAGVVIKEDVIWSCTTCGACEEECPVFVQYIDKVVDMRRYLVEQGEGPVEFNQVFMHMEKTGNPFGKPQAKRADWIKELEGIQVRILKKGDQVDTLLFVDSYPSFDPKAQAITMAVAKAMALAGEDFGVLGPKERDSGHQVRRMGEEGLFQLLKEQNLEAFGSVRFKRIVTVDPHAFNTLKNDYQIGLPVYHYTQFCLELLETGRLRPGTVSRDRVYSFHDPCYLGRHNGIYDAPRTILKGYLDARVVEMKRSRDRSFCCGGADVALWQDRKSTRLNSVTSLSRMPSSA
jgi:Fe-S oxidoreductase